MWKASDGVWSVVTSLWGCCGSQEQETLLLSDVTLLFTVTFAIIQTGSCLSHERNGVSLSCTVIYNLLLDSTVQPFLTLWSSVANPNFLFQKIHVFWYTTVGRCENGAWRFEQTCCLRLQVSKIHSWLLKIHYASFETSTAIPPLTQRHISENLPLLWKRKVHDWVHENPLLHHVLSQFIPAHILTHSFFNTVIRRGKVRPRTGHDGPEGE